MKTVALIIVASALTTPVSRSASPHSAHAFRRLADVTGTWSGTAESRFPSGKVETHEMTFIFKQSGASLTGSMGPDAQHQFSIDNGTVSSDTLTFDCKWGNGALIHVHLAPSGDGLRGKAEGDASQVPANPGPNFTNTIYLTLKRQPKAGTPPQRPPADPGEPVR